jgi:hypothetical protein
LAQFAGITLVGRIGMADAAARAIAFLIEDSFMTGRR